MQMLNRAIEDAAAASEFLRQLETSTTRSPEVETADSTSAPAQGRVRMPSPKRPGENRAQYRARLRAEAHR